MAVAMAMLLLIEFVSVVHTSQQHARPYIVLWFALQTIAYLAKQSYLTFSGVSFDGGSLVGRQPTGVVAHDSPAMPMMPIDSWKQSNSDYSSYDDQDFDPYLEIRGTPFPY
jgi:hypothetical protein